MSRQLCLPLKDRLLTFTGESVTRVARFARAVVPAVVVVAGSVGVAIMCLISAFVDICNQKQYVKFAVHS